MRLPPRRKLDRPLLLKDRNSANGAGCTATDLEGKADEPKPAAADELIEICKAFHIPLINHATRHRWRISPDQTKAAGECRRLDPSRVGNRRPPPKLCF